MFANVQVRQDQVGLWYRRGRFLRSLGPGDYPLIVDGNEAEDRIDVVAMDDPRRHEAEAGLMLSPGLEIEFEPEPD